jgi:elongation factor 1 alpha-like protein
MDSDKADWKEEVFENIKGRLHSFIIGKECGFKESNVTYVPLSGFTGENMLERKEEKLLSWWKGHTLIEALNALNPPPRAPPTGPLRIPISDLYKSGSTAVASGKVEAGAVNTGQKVVLLPSNEQTTVKSLQSRNQVVRTGRAGDYMDTVSLPVELQFACIGGVICDTANPVPVADVFQAMVLVFDIDVPIMKGQQFMCYLHVETLRATVLKLDRLCRGGPTGKKPKALKKNDVAVISLRVDRKVCLEPKPQDDRPTTALSRLVLRDRGQTVAAGTVVSV